LIGLNNARPFVKSSTLWWWAGSYEGLYFIREAAEQDLYFGSVGCQHQIARHPGRKDWQARMSCQSLLPRWL